MADSKGQFSEWGKSKRISGRKSKTQIRDGSAFATNELADTKGERVQGLWASGEQESDSHGQKKLPLCESQGRIKAEWPSEPRLGRVVDGCANRVDRIRLLGNGVVPQTAAKAWQVLDARFNDE